MQSTGKFCTHSVGFNSIKQMSKHKISVKEMDTDKLLNLIEKLLNFITKFFITLLKMPLNLCKTLLFHYYNLSTC